MDNLNQNKPISTSRLKKMKKEQTPIAMVTSYDYPSARLAEQAGADILLVGDSLGNVVLGYESTLPVTLEDMIYHTKAVSRAASRAFVVTDMPFNTYHGSVDRTLEHAGRIMQEGFAKALKLEGGQEIAGTVQALTKAGIPVMGHLGLTPQSIYQLGGYFIQGKTPEKARQMLEDAKRLEEAGAFALVLELVPEQIAAWITSQLTIPTIGIGAGGGCDGQVLVFHDLLQYGSVNDKKFVKAYANIGEQIQKGISNYVQDVKSRAFPAAEHAFAADVSIDELEKLYGDPSSDKGKE